MKRFIKEISKTMTMKTIIMLQHRNVTFEDETDNASTSHIATNILDILPENNIGDNDDSQQNDNYSISSNEHNNYEEFQSANSLTAISSNEYEEEFQSGKQRNHEVSQILAEFGRMNNILEICNWLVKNPSILQLANQMYTASSSSIENIGTLMNRQCLHLQFCQK
ncbi:hypothetical protein F8M41_024331 [Gigaspora margarita]|uniref:Uncharacterized protein n=1 Tax=Gigaspora margarita TaxID=4874 RepID=A0A8H3XP53_GIGMA|nr:hypothetical protein F8M41_024331 [Gigaspora margarita]